MDLWEIDKFIFNYASQFELKPLILYNF